MFPYTINILCFFYNFENFPAGPDVAVIRTHGCYHAYLIFFRHGALMAIGSI